MVGVTTISFISYVDQTHLSLMTLYHMSKHEMNEIYKRGFSWWTSNWLARIYKHIVFMESYVK